MGMDCTVVYRGSDGLFTLAFRYSDGVPIIIGDDVCMVEKDGSRTDAKKCLGFVADENGPAINLDGDLWYLEIFERDGTTLAKPARDERGRLTCRTSQ